MNYGLVRKKACLFSTDHCSVCSIAALTCRLSHKQPPCTAEPVTVWEGTGSMTFQVPAEDPDGDTDDRGVALVRFSVAGAEIERS